MHPITTIELQEAIRSKKLRITDHADEEAINDSLLIDDIFTSVFNGEIIESYTKDKPYPSCLVFGTSAENEPIHSGWAYNKMNGYAVLITVYRPDPVLWTNFRERKKKA